MRICFKFLNPSNHADSPQIQQTKPTTLQKVKRDFSFIAIVNEKSALAVHKFLLTAFFQNIPLWTKDNETNGFLLVYILNQGKD